MTATNETMTINLDLEAQDFLRIEGIHSNCWVASLLNSVRWYRQEVDQLQSHGAEGRSLRLAVKHVGQFENLLLKEIKESREDLQFFRDNASALSEAITAGKDYSFTDWGGGWEWKARVVEVNGVRVQIHDTGFSLYRGQNGKSLIKKDFLSLG
jgi:hypothetical protein